MGRTVKNSARRWELRFLKTIVNFVFHEIALSAGEPERGNPRSILDPALLALVPYITLEEPR